MNQKTVYQTDLAGHFIGVTVADTSQLESDVWLMPAGTIETAPPEEWPDDQWPRWNGSGWALVTRPAVKNSDEAKDDALNKIRAFLAANPEVAGYLGTQ